LIPNLLQCTGAIAVDLQEERIAVNTMHDRTGLWHYSLSTYHSESRMEIENSIRPNPSRPESAPQEKSRADAALRLQDVLQTSTWLNAAQGAIERIQRRYTPAMASDQKQSEQWLFCVDVTTKDFGAGDNIALRLSQFQKLAEQTKDKPDVAIVIQTAVADVEQNSLPLYGKVFNNPYHIDRYIIRDGAIQKIDSVNSSGLTNDIRNLLSFAGNHFNSKHTSLIIDSHGRGNEGLNGDTGSSKLDEMIAAIKAGLGPGKKLDLIDFDSCIMAQNGVLKHIHEVTDQVVASPETEGGKGQDLTGPITRVVQEPKTTAFELAEIMINTARQQTPESPSDTQFKLRSREQFAMDGKVQIPTLAHFDLTHYDSFRKELDQFGDALVQAIKDPKGRHSIDRIISDTPTYGAFQKKRDLKGFIEQVLDGIANKRIPDHDGQLRLHGGVTLDALKKLVPSYSGFDKYASRGGLTVFLPERSQVDFHEFGKETTTAHALLREASNPPDLVDKKAAYVEWMRDHLSYMMNQQIRLLEPKTPPKEIEEVKLAWNRARHAVNDLDRATDLKDTLPALAELRAAASNLIATRFYDNWAMEQERSHKAIIAERFAEQLVNDCTGWGRFRQALRRLD
jgi:hypothetical protein